MILFRRRPFRLRAHCIQKVPNVVAVAVAEPEPIVARLGLILDGSAVSGHIGSPVQRSEGLLLRVSVLRNFSPTGENGSIARGVACHLIDRKSTRLNSSHL